MLKQVILIQIMQYRDILFMFCQKSCLTEFPNGFLVEYIPAFYKITDIH